MITRTSNGSELRIIMGEKAAPRTRQESRDTSNYFEEAHKKETRWRDDKIHELENITNEARLEISKALKTALRRIQGEIPDLLEERMLRGSQEYLSIKRTDPETAKSIHGLGIGIIERFNRTVDQKLCGSVFNTFGGLMEELVISNRMYNIDMPSAKADAFADKYAKAIETEVVRLKDSTIALLEASSNAQDIAMVKETLSERADAIIIRMTEDIDKINGRGLDGRSWFSRGSA